MADYYAERRQVPTNQIFGFHLTTNEDMSRAEFRDALQKPLAGHTEEAEALANRPGHLSTRPPTTPAGWNGSRARIQNPLRGALLRRPAADRQGPESQRAGAGEPAAGIAPQRGGGGQRTGPAAADRRTTCRWPARCETRSIPPTNSALLNPTNGVLLVARLDGPTPAIARGLVDKALQAETDGLWGRAYFDLRNIKEPGLQAGRRLDSRRRRKSAGTWVLRRSWMRIPAPSRPAFPMSQIAIYIGWYDGDVSGPFAQPTVEFMPGRVCVSSAFLQRGDPAQHQPQLGRPAAGQGRHHHDGLRGRALPVRHARTWRFHRAPDLSAGSPSAKPPMRHSRCCPGRPRWWGTRFIGPSAKDPDQLQPGTRGSATASCWNGPVCA